MIRLGELKGASGATHRVKRLGRGAGSGKGDTSGKAIKVFWREKVAAVELDTKGVRLR